MVSEHVKTRRVRAALLSCHFILNYLMYVVALLQSFIQFINYLNIWKELVQNPIQQGVDAEEGGQPSCQWVSEMRVIFWPLAIGLVAAAAAFASFHKCCLARPKPCLAFANQQGLLLLVQIANSKTLAYTKRHFGENEMHQVFGFTLWFEINIICMVLVGSKLIPDTIVRLFGTSGLSSAENTLITIMYTSVLVSAVASQVLIHLC